MHLHFYWTTADTVTALVAGGASMFGLYLGQIAERLLARRNS
jgi:hypothetical protein